MTYARRELLSAGPALGLWAILAGAARGSTPVQTGDTYRVDDEATILAAARAIIGEDPVAALITIDDSGVSRARSVGVSDPEDDLTMWIGTRRGSRKTLQLQANPAATLYFNRDDIDGNFAGAYYASFMGKATVHTDEATMAAHAPDESYRKTLWPNFPIDFAAIRFRPRWLEVTGRGIKGDTRFWQPQAVILKP